MRSLNNPFIHAVGFATIAYVLFQLLARGLYAFSTIAASLATWTKYSFLPWSEELAIGLGVAFLLVTAVTTSRNSR